MNEKIISKFESVNKKVSFLKKKILRLKIDSNQIKYKKKLTFIENSLYQKNITLQQISLLRKKVINLFLELREIKNKDLSKYLIQEEIIKRELSIYSCFDDITDIFLLEKKFQEECLLRYNLFYSNKEFDEINSSLDRKKYKKKFTLLKNKKLENERIKQFKEKINLNRSLNYVFLNQLVGDYYFYFYFILSHHLYLEELSSLTCFYHKTKTYDSIKDILNNSKEYLKNKYRIEDIEKFIDLLTNQRIEKFSQENKNVKELVLEDLNKFIDFFILKKRNRIKEEDIIQIFNFLDEKKGANISVSDFIKKFAFLSSKENLMIYFFNRYTNSSYENYENYDFENNIESFFQIFNLFFEKNNIFEKDKLRHSIINTLSSKRNHNELHIHNLNILRTNSKIFLEIDLNESLETLNKYVSDAKDYFLNLRKDHLLIDELFNFPDYKENVFSYLVNSSLSLNNKNILLGDLLFIFDCKSINLTSDYIITQINYNNHNKSLLPRKPETVKKQYDVICDIIFNKKFYKYS